MLAFVYRRRAGKSWHFCHKLTFRIVRGRNEMRLQIVKAKWCRQVLRSSVRKAGFRTSSQSRGPSGPAGAHSTFMERLSPRGGRGSIINAAIRTVCQGKIQKLVCRGGVIRQDFLPGYSREKWPIDTPTVQTTFHSPLEIHTVFHNFITDHPKDAQTSTQGFSHWISSLIKVSQSSEQWSLMGKLLLLL